MTDDKVGSLTELVGMAVSETPDREVLFKRLRQLMKTDAETALDIAEFVVDNLLATRPAKRRW